MDSSVELSRLGLIPSLSFSLFSIFPRCSFVSPLKGHFKYSKTRNKHRCSLLADALRLDNCIVFPFLRRSFPSPPLISARSWRRTLVKNYVKLHGAPEGREEWNIERREFRVGLTSRSRGQERYETKGNKISACPSAIRPSRVAQSRSNKDQRV